MKNLFLSLLLLVVNVCFAQIPELAKRTLQGLSTTEDFSNQKTYIVNVDTLKWAQETVSGNITYYQEKEKMVQKLNSIFGGLDLGEMTHFEELNDNPYISPRKLHWVMITKKYRIDWWFSPTNENKLETITLVKY